HDQSDRSSGWTSRNARLELQAEAGHADAIAARPFRFFNNRDQNVPAPRNASQHGSLVFPLGLLNRSVLACEASLPAGFVMLRSRSATKNLLLSQKADPSSSPRMTVTRKFTRETACSNQDNGRNF